MRHCIIALVILALTLPRLRGAIAKRAKKEGARA